MGRRRALAVRFRDPETFREAVRVAPIEVSLEDESSEMIDTLLIDVSLGRDSL